MDEDISSKPALRLSPHEKRNFSHRFQWLHAFILYGLTTLFWVTAKDFIQFARYKNNNVSNASDGENRLILFKIVILKVVYFLVFLLVPVLLFSISFTQVLMGFLLMHFIAGVVLTVIFQLAHSLEGTNHPLPKNGVLENDWAIHQMNTTMNFSPDNRLLSWYVGGLNYQVEHHLFPRISHVHYPALSRIVRSTASEYHIPYLQHQTFRKAITAHIYFLKKLGKISSLEEAIG
jgi:linoleoyl-CoA desaturase